MHQDMSTLLTGQTNIERAVAVSALKFFQWQNESYLAIGQSLCSLMTADDCVCIVAEASCSDKFQSPAVRILQWD